MCGWADEPDLAELIVQSINFQSQIVSGPFEFLDFLQQVLD